MANEVRVLVKADTKDAQQDIQAFERKISSGLGGAATVGGAALLSLGAAGVAGIGLSIKSAASFEKAIDQVAAVAQATTGEVKGLSDTALRIGKDTAFSATEVAGAMEALAANGITAKDIMGGAADAAATLAAAGGTDLAIAADTASTAMAVWGLKTNELTDVVNRLAGAANVSRFGVDDMSLAIAQGGGAAATAGVSFADFSTVVASTASSFASGSDAGTSFKTFITALPGNSNKAKDAIKELGLQFYNADGSMRSMADITQELHDKLGPLSQEQQTVALKTIFGNDAFRTAAGLMKLTGDEFSSMSSTMSNTSALDVAHERMSNMSGATEQLKGAIETIGIQIGMKFIPALTELTLWLAEKLPVAFAFLEEKVMPHVERAFDAIAAAVETTFNAALPYIQQFASDAGTAFKEFAGYYETDIKPALDNIAAAVMYAVGVVSRNWDSIRPVFEGVGKVVVQAAEIIRNALQIVIDILGGDWAGAWQNTVEMLRAVVDGWKAQLGLWVDAIKALVSIAVTVGGDIIKGLADGAAALWTSVLWPWLQALPGEMLEAMGDLWELGLKQGKRLLAAMFAGIENVWLFDIQPWFVGLPGQIFAAIGDLATAMYNAGAKAASSFIQGLKDSAVSLAQTVAGLFNPTKWDIPGGSPLMHAMDEFGYEAGDRFSQALAVGLGDGFHSAVVPMLASMGPALQPDLYANVPDYVKKFSPAAGGKLDFSSPGDYTQAYIGGGQYGYMPVTPKVGDWMGQGQAAVQWDGTRWVQGGPANAGTFYPGMYDKPAPGTVIQLVVDGQVLADTVVAQAARAM